MCGLSVHCFRLSVGGLCLESKSCVERSFNSPAECFLEERCEEGGGHTNQTVGIMCIYMCISHNPGPGKFVLIKTCNLDLASQLLSDFLKHKTV